MQMAWPGTGCLAALTEFTTEAMTLVSSDGIIEWASPSTRDVLGFSPDTLVGTRARDLVVPEDVGPWRALVEQMLEQPGIACAASFRCRHRDGTVRWTYGVARNLLTDPRVGAVLISFRDVTPTREIEAALQVSEDRYRQLFDEATDVVFEADEEGYFRFVNPATIRAFGYDKGEVLGRRFTEFIREDHRRRVFDHYRTQIDTRQVSSYIEFPAVAKNGSEIWLGQNAWMVADEHGRFRGMRAVARDITQRRRAVDALRDAEAKYRSLVERALFAVFIMQGERLVYVNPKGVEMTGYTAEELLAMPSIVDLVAESDRAYVRDQFARLMKGAASVQFVMRGHRKDGTVVLAEANSSVSEYGGAAAIFSTVTDISDRLRLEEQLRQAHKMEAVGRLAGGIAHDFNNLLTAIRGNAELMHHRVQGDPLLVAEVEEVLQAADRAASLTRQLLAFSRKQDLTAVTLDLNELVDNVARMTRRLIGPNVQLEIRRGRALRTVVADAAQLEQVLLNLIINARDALPDGGRITVRTANVEIADGSSVAATTGLPDGPYVLLQVRDDGIGMDPATQARIFEPFFTTKEPGRGTGLGLSTVYGHIRQMGGAVAVDSERNRGATFSIYLPPADVQPAIPSRTSPTEET
jgi:two-component system, cell cycle sensor histidine kinase and response regulator CckA